jgi:two-component system, sensor histidine kinase
MLSVRSERVRILFAEDNPTNQLVVQQLLKDFDVQVDVVGDGREAVDAAARFAYDIIFMDMRMPEMDGLRATQAIRQLGGRLSAIPIIALTANAFAEDVKACMDAGMNAFLSKPVNKGMLFTTLLQVLSDGAQGGPVVPLGSDHLPATEARDRAGLAELRDEIGPRAVGEMLAIFEGDTRASLRTMAESLDDSAVLLHEAHSLRGAAAAVSASVLSELMRNIEEELRFRRTSHKNDIEKMGKALGSYLTMSRSFAE